MNKQNISFREANFNKKKQESSASIYYSLSNSKPTKTQLKNYSNKNKQFIKKLETQVRIQNTPASPKPNKVNSNYKHITSRIDSQGSSTRATTPNFIERNKSVASNRNSTPSVTSNTPLSRPQTSLGRIPK